MCIVKVTCASQTASKPLSRRCLLLCLSFVASFAPLVWAIPNFLPPPHQEALLPRNWQRGFPPDAEDGWPDLVRRRYNRKKDHPGPSELHQCLKSLSRDWDLTSPHLNASDIYWDAAQSDNLRFHYHPDAIVYPRSDQDVARAIRCARDHGNVPVTARSGGHSFVGLGTGGEDGHLVIDLQYLNHIHVRADGKSADIGPGALLGDVIKGLWGSRGEHQLGIPHGTCPVVGTGGHALCGGFGPTSRKWGLTTDAFTEARVVLANSSIVTVHRDAEAGSPAAQLIKALKGTGPQFAIVTNFKFQTFDASGPMTFLEYRWSPSLRSAEDMSRIVSAVQSFATEAKSHLPRELGFHLQFQSPLSSDPQGGDISIHLRGVYMGRKAALQHDVMSHLFMRHIPKHGAPQPDAKREEEMPYLDIMREWDDFGQPGKKKLDTAAEKVKRNNFLARTQLTVGDHKGFSDTSLRKLMGYLYDANRGHWHTVGIAGGINVTSPVRESVSPSDRQWNWNVYMEMYGGPSPRHADTDLVKHSSFPFRDGTWLIQSSIGTWGHRSLDPAAHHWLSSISNGFKEAIKTDGMDLRSFPCYADASLRDRHQWKHLYHGEEIMAELEKTKAEVDPWNTFRSPMSIWGVENRLPEKVRKEQEARLKVKRKREKARRVAAEKAGGGGGMGSHGKHRHHGATIKMTENHAVGVRILHPLPRSLPWGSGSAEDASWDEGQEFE